MAMLKKSKIRQSYSWYRLKGKSDDQNLQNDGMDVTVTCATTCCTCGSQPREPHYGATGSPPHELYSFVHKRSDREAPRDPVI